MTTVLFLRTYVKDKNEVSGYIDLAHRMKTEDFRAIFMGNEIIVPKPTDLSYYSWES